MIQTRASVNTPGGSHLSSDITRIKSIEQFISEGNEIRVRSSELSNRIKRFLEPSDKEMRIEKNHKIPDRLICVKEDDIIEIINDVQDENCDVMDVRVPRIETSFKSNDVISENGLRSNNQQAEREYRILKQLLKDTEETNRRNKELIIQLEKILARKERLVKTPKKIKIKKTSDGKLIKSTSTKICPKTSNEIKNSRVKRPSKIPCITVIKAPNTGKGKIQGPSKMVSSTKEKLPKSPSPTKTQSIKDMISTIERRGDNEEIPSNMSQMTENLA